MPDLLDDPRVRAHLERICKDHGLDVDDLPDGFAPADILDRHPLQDDREPAWDVEAEQVAAGDRRRRPGHPRPGDHPIPWEQVEHLLVFGEDYSGDDGKTYVRYPTPGELAKRFNCDPKTIRDFAKKRDTAARRTRIECKTQAYVEEAVATTHAVAIASAREQVVSICDGFIQRFAEALAAKKIRTDSIADLNTIVRLREFVVGGPDQRTETSHVLSLEVLQRKHAEYRQEVDSDPAMALLGVVEEGSVAQQRAAILGRGDVIDVQAEPVAAPAKPRRSEKPDAHPKGGLDEPEGVGDE